ncbi:MAG TPA: UDP-N-acetylmuramoyl-L-alanyl-D-glutamate--2,6-diaminopimelate ligase [Gammaproteobacteria bacterium]|nr:UDP-N-acetylmuramoyl-L-alanyl-D-glutamate--2,6-diaminopimelate ligase [Gammaproteobacteria bacterium]
MKARAGSDSPRRGFAGHGVPGRPARRLDVLLEGLADGHVPPLEVTDLSAHSDQVAPGGAFLACRGLRSHGLDHLPAALAAGAAAIIWEPADGLPPPAIPDGIATVPVRKLGHSLGEIASRFFGAPSARLRVAGITGTNGKTTTACLIATSLERRGRACGFLGTLGTGRPDALERAPLTTLDAVTLQRRMAGFADGGVGYVAMEVSSHALDQGRACGVRFAVAVLTNLSRDHLDYHGDHRAYGAAKARLFTQHEVERAVVNAGDPFGREVLARLGGRLRPVAVALGERPQPPAADFVHGTLIRSDVRGLQVRFTSSWGAGTLTSPLIGDFNAENLLLALAVLLLWELPLDEALAGLAGAHAAPGRMERFPTATGALALVDFAHTPAALARALQAARAICAGQVWCVFGCGGERDRGKRGLMGEIAEQHADRIVLTDDNPRGEDAARIVRDIQSGMANPAAAIVQREREQAIGFALAHAQQGDVVLVAGKGHESYQIVGGEQRAWSDREAVARLARLGLAADNGGRP